MVTEPRADLLSRLVFSPDERIQRDALAEFTALLWDHMWAQYALRVVGSYLVLTIYHGERDDRVHMGIPEALKRHIGIIQVVEPETNTIVHAPYNPTGDLRIGQGIWPDAKTWDPSIGLKSRRGTTQWDHLLEDD